MRCAIKRNAVSASVAKASAWVRLPGQWSDLLDQQSADPMRMIVFVRDHDPAASRRNSNKIGMWNWIGRPTRKPHHVRPERNRSVQLTYCVNDHGATLTNAWSVTSYFPLKRCMVARFISRSVSRSLMSSRLSNWTLPLPTPRATFTLPSFQ